MERNQTGFWRLAAQCLAGGIALALVTLVAFKLQVNLTIASLLYLTVVVLMAFMDAFVGSIFVSVISVLCLDYFFTQPLFSLRMADPLNIVAVIVFLGTALLITRVMSQRKRAEAALQQVLGELESKVQERTAELAKSNDDLRGQILERQRAEEALQKAQAELAHVSRLMTLGELTASISHEVNQPIAAGRHQRPGLPAIARARDATTRRCANHRRAHGQGRPSGERSDSADSRARQKDRAADGIVGHQRCYPRGYPAGAA